MNDNCSVRCSIGGGGGGGGRWTEDLGPTQTKSLTKMNSLFLCLHFHIWFTVHSPNSLTHSNSFSNSAHLAIGSHKLSHIWHTEHPHTIHISSSPAADLLTLTSTWTSLSCFLDLAVSLHTSLFCYRLCLPVQLYTALAFYLLSDLHISTISFPSTLIQHHFPAHTSSSISHTYPVTLCSHPFLVLSVTFLTSLLPPIAANLLPYNTFTSLQSSSFLHPRPLTVTITTVLLSANNLQTTFAQFLAFCSLSSHLSATFQKHV